MSKLSAHERALLLLRVATLSLVLALSLIMIIKVSAAQSARPNSPITIEDARQTTNLTICRRGKRNFEN